MSGQPAPDIPVTATILCSGSAPVSDAGPSEASAETDSSVGTGSSGVPDSSVAGGDDGGGGGSTTTPDATVSAESGVAADGASGP